MVEVRMKGLVTLYTHTLPMSNVHVIIANIKLEKVNDSMYCVMFSTKSQYFDNATKYLVRSF